ncbi:phosphoribosyltransferase [bacterium]|nr:phosphoribosyltransferase [bacterium]
MSNKKSIEEALSSFDSKTREEFVEFSKAISRAEGDLVICMARKAARIFDLLVMAGMDAPKRAPLHHYFLEHAISTVRGKRVVLIDDTVIVGTTLGKVKRQLLEAGALSVQVIVFAVDTDYWSKEMIDPDQIFIKLPHHEMRTFCAAEVQALHRAGIPYLSDFPKYNPIIMTSDNFSRMQGQFSWEVHAVSHRFDAPDDASVNVFTILPSETQRENLDLIIGRKIAHALDIAKIRCFGVKNDDGKQIVQCTPIVTLSPLQHGTVGDLFETIVARLEEVSDKKLTWIRSELDTPKSQVRFCQYILSAILGTLFSDSLSKILGLEGGPQPSIHEPERIFGPKSKRDISICHRILSRICVEGLAGNDSDTIYERTPLPVSVTSVSRNECLKFLGAKGGEIAENLTGSLRSDLEKIFLGLYNNHEIPAREEVKKFGSEIFDITAAEVPHRDRLGFGMDWGTISETLLAARRLNTTPQRRAHLSLLLDQLIDDGIAVPILADKDGVVFRAYRHGEDVEFANQEKSLTFDTAEGFLEVSNRTTIPRLTMEKLLVALLRVGTQKKFLSPVHGVVGSGGGIARVAYHLHGAVVTLPGDSSPLADSTDSWLTKFLLDEEVILEAADRSYQLGKRPEAAHITASAPEEARQLGNILGILLTQKDGNGKSGLTEKELVLLTTCPQAKHVALASVAELKLILSGLRSRLIGWERYSLDIDRSTKLLGALRKDNVRTAIFSAIMKISAHKTGRVNEILKRSENHLASIPIAGPPLRNYWMSAWRPLVENTYGNQQAFFSEWIDRVHKMISDLALGVFTVELALASRVEEVSKDKKSGEFRRSCRKISKLLPDLSPSPDAQVLFERIEDTVSNHRLMTSPESSLRFGIDFASRRQVRGNELVRQVCEASANYGRQDRRVDFDYVLWYDVIDSTGQKSGFKGDALREYRDRIRKFKGNVIQTLEAFSNDFKMRSVTIHPWAGDLISKDDEKNIFFSGPRCFSALTETFHALLAEAHLQNIHLRVIILNTNFAGFSAHKYDNKPTVDGEAFWEHSSRLKTALKKYEKQTIIQTYVWLCDETSKSLSMRRKFEGIWPEGKDGEVECSIENYPLHTEFFGGEIHISPEHDSVSYEPITSVEDYESEGKSNE